MLQHKYILFLILVACSLFLVFLSDYLLFSDTLFFNTLAEQMSYEQIEGIIANTKKWKWLGYVFSPLLLSLKITLVSLCLALGLYFYTNQFRFKTVLGVALQAEFVFLLPTLLKIFWFLFVQTHYTLQDLQSFYPLSMLHFFDAKAVDTWLLYPLQVCNVFEVFYWVLLAKGLSQAVQQMQDVPQKISSTFHFRQALGLVGASYGTALVLWITCMMFLAVSFSP